MHVPITRAKREALNGHNGIALWFTGLPSSGKSTIAHEVEERLYEMGCRTFVFDGDNVRHGLCSDLGFSREDRAENIRRIGEMVKLFVEAGVIAITAFISPFRAEREKVKKLLGEEDFIEIYCRCPVEICEQRDLKGNYRRANTGEIKEFTGSRNKLCYGKGNECQRLYISFNRGDTEVCNDFSISLSFRSSAGMPF